MNNKFCCSVVSYLCLIILASCSSGNNSSKSSAENYTLQEDGSEWQTNISNKIKLADYRVTDLSRLMRSIKARHSKLKSQDTTYSAIGWDSSTQDFAPQSCWDYNITLRDHSNNTNSYYTQFASNIQVGLGLTNSVSLKAGELEEGSLQSTFNILAGNQYNAVTIGTLAYSKATANIQITGLNPTGQSILQNNPTNFSRLCGDKILTQLPVMTQVSFTLKYNFESASTNDYFSSTLSQSDPFEKTTQTLNASISAGISQVNVEQQLFTQGNVDTNTIKTANLSSCTQVGESAAGACNNALTILSTAAEAGYQNALSLLNSGEGQSIEWQSLLATDYSRSSSFAYIDTNQELINLGLSTIPNNPSFNPYESQIIRNLNVLQDLETAQLNLNNIAVGISLLPPDFANNFTPYYNLTVLQQDYSVALIPSINNLSSLINECIYSSDVTDIQNNCSNLDPEASVIGVFEKNFQYNPNVPNLGPSLEKTIQAMIYSDDVQ